MDVPKKISWLRLVLALAVMHTLTSVRYYPLGDAPWSQTWWRINPDLVLLLAIGCVVTLRFGFLRLVGHLFVLGLIWVPLYRLPHVVFRASYNTKFLLYENIGQVDGAWMLVADQCSAMEQFGIVAGASIGIAAIWMLVYVSTRCVLRAATRRTFTISVLGLAQLFAMAMWAEDSARPGAENRFAGPSMYACLGHEGLELLREQTFGDGVATIAAEMAQLPGQLSGLHGADVYVMFVESYGRVVFENEVARRTLEPRCQDFQKTLETKGFHVRSAFIAAPVFGGSSHCAHATLLCGTLVKSYHDCKLLERSELRGLPHYFNATGYLTINAQPKLDREWDVSEQFFGFQQDLFGKDMPYLEKGGFPYHWSPIPDQFCLQFALQHSIRPSDRPVFMQFISVTSHMPFSHIPPYHENWTTAADPRAYAPAKTYDGLEWHNYYERPDKDEAFRDSIVYSLQTLVGFAEQLDRPAMVIILGDHQPPRVCEIEGRMPTFDVPIHVIANRPYLLEPFARQGFSEGFIPTATESFPMARFLPRFVGDFGK